MRIHRNGRACEATKRACPLGEGEHYGSEQELAMAIMLEGLAQAEQDERDLREHDRHQESARWESQRASAETERQFEFVLAIALEPDDDQEHQGEPTGITWGGYDNDAREAGLAIYASDWEHRARIDKTVDRALEGLTLDTADELRQRLIAQSDPDHYPAEIGRFMAEVRAERSKTQPEPALDTDPHPFRSGGHDLSGFNQALDYYDESPRFRGQVDAVLDAQPGLDQPQRRELKNRLLMNGEDDWAPTVARFHGEVLDLLDQRITRSSREWDHTPGEPPTLWVETVGGTRLGNVCRREGMYLASVHDGHGPRPVDPFVVSYGTPAQAEAALVRGGGVGQHQQRGVWR